MRLASGRIAFVAFRWGEYHLKTRFDMRLGEEIHLAILGSEAVILDLKRDRYTGLNPRLTAAIIRALTSDDLIEDDPAIVALSKRGFIVDHVSSQDERPTLPRHASNSIWPSIRHGLGWNPPAQATETLNALGLVQASLHFRHLFKTINWLRREKSAAHGKPNGRSSAEILDRFHAVRPWFPYRPICRLDATALCLLLWRHGYPADLVFGVRVRPFAAHCWVQHQDSVLFDTADMTATYTPIMAV